MDAETSIPARARSRVPLAILGALAAAVLVGVWAGAAINGLHSSQGSGARAGFAGDSAGGGLSGQATWAAGVRPAPPITTLRDVSGRAFALSSLRGHTVALVFFDSHCNQECPLEGRALAVAERSVPVRDRPVLVVVSVNPSDTAASVHHAVTTWGLARAGSWHWLVGTRASLAPVWHAYRIWVGHPLHGDIPHTEAVYLIGRSGDERSAYLYPFMPTSVTHDLRALARVPERARDSG
jgi:cytochrome oxidase Cu insertion factor (SCO1/SenC/PrrC family)